MTRERRAEIAHELMRPLMAHVGQAEVVRWMLGERTENLAVIGSRRGGKSTLADAVFGVMILLDGFVVRMLTQVLRSPTVNVLEKAGGGGTMEKLEAFGLKPGVHMEIDRAAGAVVGVRFPWRSELSVHDVGSDRAIQKQHGFAASLYWVDEAQYVTLLFRVIANLIAPTLVEQRAAILLSGTPGEPGTLFDAIVAGGDDAYKVRRLAVWQNPMFGATWQERWLRVVDTSIARARGQYSVTAADLERIRALSLADLEAIAVGEESGDVAEWVKTLDPELLRQVFGRRVIMAGEYVYAWHRIQPEQLYYGALPGHEIPGVPVAATLAARRPLLPTHDARGGAFRWRVAIAADIGYNPDPFAVVVIAYADGHGTAYELLSYKQNGLADSEMRTRIERTIAEVSAAGFAVSGVVADLGGMREGTRIEWDRDLAARFGDLGVSVRSPRKTSGYKIKRTRQINLDMESGKLRVIAGSALDMEGRHLRYKLGDPGEATEVDKHREVHGPDGSVIVYGNDCLDCLLYAAEDVGFLLERPAPVVDERPAVIRRYDEWHRRQMRR